MDKQFNFDVTPQAVSQVIDLQGVAAFAGLVELLATELGSQANSIQGQLPDKPGPFQELVGSVELTRQGILKKIVLTTSGLQSVTIQLQCSLKNVNNGTKPSSINLNNSDKSYEVAASLEINKSVASILPQGRALARHLEDMFAILERMLALGQLSKVIGMSPSVSEIEAFELAENDNLVRRIV